jgi:pSer/pThr/pTyr-binding forkhead associated (FHA) protein
LDETNTNNSIGFMAIALGGVSIVAIGAVIFLLLRQQKRSVIHELDNYVDDDNSIPPMRSIPVYRKVEEDRKSSNLEPESDALGALTIEASDDESLIGHRFEITASLITLGRSADNDINFPNDKPVSRHHAEIYQISGKLYLREVTTADSSGSAQPPKYGTFLNTEPMGTDPALLKTGDQIQLGKRVRLKFESFSRDLGADSLTYDDDSPSAAEDMDQTSVQD